MRAPEIEKQTGMETYATRTKGIGGNIRENIEDFIVEEILVDGSIAHVKSQENTAQKKVLGCSTKETPYLLCKFLKRDWDTFVAVRNIAYRLGIGMPQIQTAGIKDAKALTAQYITVENASPEQIRKIHIKDMEIHPLGYVHNRLSAYYLWGNSFHIRISAVNHSMTETNKRVANTFEELLAIGGVPNFFGHQRFGTTRPITHLVGKAIIKKDLKKAVMLYLAKSTIHEHPSSRLARIELLKTHNFHKALKNFPKQLRYERSMLRELVENPADFSGALRTLPFKLREMFIQAYESYLFNQFLSRRIKEQLPLKTAEVGDFVIAVERTGIPTPTMSKMAKPENLTEINNAIQNGKLRLAIPLIGFRQRCSGGKQGEIEEQILEEEDVSPEEFRTSIMPEISAAGRLRTTLTPIIDFSSDKIMPNTNKPRSCNVETAFKLQKGSYATTLLREIMKPKRIIQEGF